MQASHAHLVHNTPVLHHVADLPGGNATAAAKVVASFASSQQATRFLMFRTILQVTANSLAKPAPHRPHRHTTPVFVSPLPPAPSPSPRTPLPSPPPPPRSFTLSTVRCLWPLPAAPASATRLPVCLECSRPPRSQSASYHYEVMTQASSTAPALRVVDPLELAYLARLHLGGNNDDRVTYLNDTFPAAAAPGKSSAVSVLGGAVCCACVPLTSTPL